MKHRTRLKNLNMTSVDLVRRGANQQADIMLYKSADGGQEEIPQGLWKSIQDTVSAWWNGQNEDQNLQDFNVNKSAYIDALEYSLDSIMKDDTMDSVAKTEMAIESIGQFAEALTEDFMKSLGVEYEPQNEPVNGEEGQNNQTLDGITKSQREAHDEGLVRAETTEEGEKEMKIDKSRFSAEELEQYQALIAKGRVEEEEEEYEEEEEKFVPSEKKEEEEVHPEVKKALERMEAMAKSMEMKELAEIAKKYAPLGEKEEELANTLYEMRKSSPKSYDSYVALLDKQLDMVNKSGMFQEIGKSGHGGYTGGSVVGKIDSIASEIQKADPNMNRYEAINKAWEQNPDLLAEYEREYQGGKR